MKSFLVMLLSCISLISLSQNNVNVSEKEWLDSFQVNLKKVIGKDMPSFSERADDGMLYNNDSLAGKVTLVNLWFEACTPCVAEFEELNHLKERFKNNKNFQLLTFTYETGTALKQIREKYGLGFTIIPVSVQTCYKLNFNYGFPFTMVIAKDKKITFVQLGGNVDKDKVVEYFNTALIPEIEKQLNK